MIDSYGRTIDYLRVSVTDRCNFRCVYCMPEEGAPIAPREEILTFEEIRRLVRIAASLGVTKVRLTGGEPLVRRDIDRLVAMVASTPGIADLSLTTNGYSLARHAEAMARCGLNRVNVSLDTLRPDRFQAIARRGDLGDVLAGIDAALAAGLSPVKLNCVAMRGANDDEVPDFARLTLEQPYDVRFIELMPINWSGGDEGMETFYRLAGDPGTNGDRRTNVTVYAHSGSKSLQTLFRTSGTDTPRGMLNAAQMRSMFFPTDEVRAAVEAAIGPIEPAEVITNGPARSYRAQGAMGTVGFISQITRDACERCNRLRLTADGFLRPCLMADGEVDLRMPLRSGATDMEIAGLFLKTVRHKPLEHRLEDGLSPVGRNMSRIGG